MKEKVLLVDDEEDFIDSLSERLRLRDIEVSTASTAAAALEQIETGRFDVVVLDLMMPEVDGIQALERLKATQPDLEVVFLSGHATVSKSIEAMKSGATDFLEKPVDVDVLVDRVRTAHQRRVLLVEKKIQEEMKDILKRRGW